MRLTGIIDYSIGNFLCMRGFAGFLDLSRISEPAKDIQRDLITSHEGEMKRYLSGGQFTFFPEVILCMNLQEVDANREKIEGLRENVAQGIAIKNVKISGYTFSSSVHSRKQQDNDRGFDKIQSLYLDFNPSEVPKMYRIDGNHRLSAVEEDSTYRDFKVPYCLLLFRNRFEMDKFSRALFHNINAKQIPLKSEENLKVIIEGDQVFTDEILQSDPSFGMHYYLARVTIKTVNLEPFLFVQAFIKNCRYTYFVDLYGLLLEKQVLQPDSNCVPLIADKLAEVEDALRECTKIPLENVAVLGALSYYKLTNPQQYNQFLRWIQKNYITEVAGLRMEQLIRIYDKIYENTPKDIFISMWFHEKTRDTYEAIREVCDKLWREEHFELRLLRVDENTDGYSDEIYHRIVEYIDKSALVIADLTYGNKNVHHEIGYAQGHKKKVLMLYHEREGACPEEEIGSNISMHEQVRFGTYIELKEKLSLKLKHFFTGTIE